MVKLVTVIETQACRPCRGSGKSQAGSSCSACGGSGTLEVEVVR